MRSYTPVSSDDTKGFRGPRGQSLLQERAPQVPGRRQDEPAPGEPGHRRLHRGLGPQGQALVHGQGRDPHQAPRARRRARGAQGQQGRHDRRRHGHHPYAAGGAACAAGPRGQDGVLPALRQPDGGRHPVPRRDRGHGRQPPQRQVLVHGGPRRGRLEVLDGLRVRRHDQEAPAGGGLGRADLHVRPPAHAQVRGAAGARGAGLHPRPALQLLKSCLLSFL
ncbi:hypothetical protein ON010_g15498 [Phytophthora cinnamomi]|nr:hypothetical protein ON010_g15498 [Phytophthora cinnamomi]